MIQHLPEALNTTYIVAGLIVDDKNQTSDISSAKPEYFGASTNSLITELMASTEDSGVYEINDKAFIWAKAKLKGTEYTVLHIYAAADKLRKL